MNTDRRSVRLRLRSMAPSVSISYIKSFQLPEDEELVLIQHECRGRSLDSIAIAMSVSVETVKRRRQAALAKISMTQR